MKLSKGISKIGNKRARWRMVELAWSSHGTYENATFQDPISKKYLSCSVVFTLADSADDAQFTAAGPTTNGVAPLPFSNSTLALGENASKQAVITSSQSSFKLTFDR
ncbi:hypothetical protein [Paraburkholderia humisilvae]|uniref:hypothetical protein n=1 Tax=Paraburkholderia humisilvae TaxID=627669 RepID=UPI001583D77D|nr:hypothetical protein [Paraburkholderia humisilvae]